VINVQSLFAYDAEQLTCARCCSHTQAYV